MRINLEIVTPNKVAYKATCTQVVLPSTQGEIGILPGHRPLITTLRAGEVLVHGAEDGSGQSSGFEADIAIDRGIARIQSDTVSILTEAAVDVQQIDDSAVADARKRAEEALAKAKDEKLDPAEIERLEAVARFSIAQQLARSRRGGR